MSIIDKLGIKRIELYEGAGGYYVNAGEVRDLEQQRNEMVEELIEIVQNDDECFAHTKMARSMFLGINKNRIEIIEKATGKSWEEIKQIVDKER